MLLLESMVDKIKSAFHHSIDIEVKEIFFPKENYAILCYFTSMVNKSNVQEQINLLKFQTAVDDKKWAETMASMKEPFQMEKLVEYVCDGQTVILLMSELQMIHLSLPEIPKRSIEEPSNEHVIRGPHVGFVEGFDTNLAMIRKRLNRPDLVVKSIEIGTDTKTNIYYMYLEKVADMQAVSYVESKLKIMKEKVKVVVSASAVEDYLDEYPYSPFPQLLNTERPDRVFANLVEGKVVIMSDFSPTAMIGPVTFFSFYQSPDDYNGRVLTNSFYRTVRMIGFLIAIFLPAFYIGAVSYHFEVFPLELSLQLKSAIREIPYRPIIEALILELIIEMIREATIRLPQAMVQSIGILGALVIGDVIISAGLVSNVMVIVVALTAISCYVLPSVELNTTIRILRFPFMLLAAVFGFFGIVIGSFVLFIHLFNLTSLKAPYFYPYVPLNLKSLKQILFREPFVKPAPQPNSFDPKGKKK